MKSWKVREESPKIYSLSEELGLSLIVAQLLINRGIDDFSLAKDFLYPESSSLSSPSCIPGVEEACIRIRKAIENKERLLLLVTMM